MLFEKFNVNTTASISGKYSLLFEVVNICYYIHVYIKYMYIFTNTYINSYVYCIYYYLHSHTFHLFKNKRCICYYSHT